MAFEINLATFPKQLKRVCERMRLPARLIRSCGAEPCVDFFARWGMVREVYAAQLEDLASHGYVVAAILHPYDAIVTIFLDGPQIAYSSQRWPKPPSLEGEANLMSSKWQRRRASNIRTAQLIQIAHGCETQYHDPHGLQRLASSGSTRPR
jgi:hypothetical protein